MVAPRPSMNERDALRIPRSLLICRCAIPVNNPFWLSHREKTSALTSDLAASVGNERRIDLSRRSW